MNSSLKHDKGSQVGTESVGNPVMKRAHKNGNTDEVFPTVMLGGDYCVLVTQTGKHLYWMNAGGGV